MTIYAPAYFSRRVHKYREPEIRIAKALYELWKPQSVFDAGCGIGSYLEGFAELTCSIQGCEKYLEYARPFMACTVVEHVWSADLTGILAAKAFDLVLCVEVAEHVRPSGSFQLCTNLSLLTANRLFFTAAPPGQRGHGHVNCRLPLEWREMMKGAGLRYELNETQEAIETLQAIGDPLDLCKNTMVFRR